MDSFLAVRVRSDPTSSREITSYKSTSRYLSTSYLSVTDELSFGRKRHRVSQNSGSTLGLRQRKFPRTVEDFRSRAEQAHGVVPSLRDWQAIGNPAVAPPELDVDRTIRAFLGREAVQCIGVVRVRMEVTFAVVDGE